VDVVIRYDPVVVEGGEIFAFPDFYRRNAIHNETVYQALLAAGYDVSQVDHADVRAFVERTRDLRAPLVVSLADAFKGRVTASSARAR
jgi:hypothetical protein